MKKDAFYADVKNFEGPLEASLFDDNVPTSLFFKILEKANDVMNDNESDQELSENIKQEATGGLLPEAARELSVNIVLICTFPKFFPQIFVHLLAFRKQSR